MSYRKQRVQANGANGALGEDRGETLTVQIPITERIEGRHRVEEGADALGLKVGRGERYSPAELHALSYAPLSERRPVSPKGCSHKYNTSPTELISQVTLGSEIALGWLEMNGGH